ncbi:MAG: HlyD family efflux transporter periplasmic adaptor subunit [Planctomycetota bacterium]|nr:MAG: HlyD family efflux transporter periplasmic adaptor subunit [Planctomycetota bacterium]
MQNTRSRTGVLVAGSNRSARGAGLVRVVGVSAAVLLVAAGGIWALNRDGEASAEMRAVSNVDLGRVELLSFPINTTAIGELEARNQIEIRSELDETSEIVEIVEEGRVVRKGDLLVKLNAEALQDEIDDDTLEVEQARADVTARENALKIQLSDNESRRRAGELNVELAQLALSQWRSGDVVKMRSSHKLDIEQAERDLKRLKEKFERSEELVAEGFLSQNERDLDEIAYINAQARLQTAKLDQQTYEEYQHPRDEKTKISDLEEAKAELERILSQNEINEAAKRSELETAERRLALREERLAEEIAQVEKATIYAPTGGLVVYASSVGRDRDRMMFGGDGPLQIGSQVRPNQNLIILPDTSKMVASVRVHESLAGRIRPGQRATVRVDAINGETFPGTVESVGVLAESGGWRDPNRREYTVRIALDYDNTNGKLKPSMRTETEIMLNAVESALSVPVQAVFSEGPVKYVYVPRGSRYESIPVQAGQMSDTYAEIRAGLEEGQRVLLREPEPGEVVPGDWTREQLEAVGVAVDENGKPVQARRGRMEMMQSGATEG